jgi:crotonobetainyl-CoA:carnitine CoA-transferase CaiB-like acyl-CoA transferase
MTSSVGIELGDSRRKGWEVFAVVAPLDDIRVTDLNAGTTGAVATMLLADFAAGVLNVEPSGPIRTGDPCG